MTSDRRRLMMACFGTLTPPAPNYFYVQDESGLGGEVWFPQRGLTVTLNIEYSTDGETWVSEPAISTSTRLTLPAGGRLYLRGSNAATALNNNSWRWLQCDVQHSVGGRIEYLLDASGTPENLNYSTFLGFFQHYNAANTTLIDASKLKLRDLGTTETYRNMFYNCTALVRGPFIDMPVVPVRGLQDMFHDCSSLQEVKCNATDISASFATYSWMQGVAATGTFYKAATMTSWSRSGNGIPAGWTVLDL